MGRAGALSQGLVAAVCVLSLLLRESWRAVSGRGLFTEGVGSCLLGGLLVVFLTWSSVFFNFFAVSGEGRLFVESAVPRAGRYLKSKRAFTCIDKRAFVFSRLCEPWLVRRCNEASIR